MAKQPNYVLKPALMTALSVCASTLDKLLRNIVRVQVGDETAYPFQSTAEALGIAPETLSAALTGNERLLNVNQASNHMRIGRTDFTLLHKHTSLPPRAVNLNRTIRFAVNEIDRFSNLLTELRTSCSKENA